MKNVELLTFTFLSLMFWSIGEVLSLFFTNFSQKTMPQFAGAWEKLLKDVKKARKENGKSRLSSSKTFSHRCLVRTFLHFWPPKYYSGHGSESEKLNHYDQILPREYVLIVMHSTFNVCSKHSSNTLLRLLRIFMRQTLEFRIKQEEILFFSRCFSLLLTCLKGQIKSECIYEIIDFPKYRWNFL